MPTKCCWVIHGSLTSERKASTSPSSFINHSTLLLNRALKRQAPCLYMHFEVRALDRLRTRRRVGSTRRRGNHMHDHSRFQRDTNDVTGVSLFLYLSQKSLTHNIGSASALPIIYFFFWSVVFDRCRSICCKLFLQSCCSLAQRWALRADKGVVTISDSLYAETPQCFLTKSILELKTREKQENCRDFKSTRSTQVMGRALPSNLKWRPISSHLPYFKR